MLNKDFLKKFSCLEYLVDDYLEMSCFLSEPKRKFLLHRLALEDCRTARIEVHPAFSIGHRFISVVESNAMKECWFYYPAQNKIERHLLTA